MGAPKEPLRNLISRSHFKVVGRRKCSRQVTQYVFYIACLSQNGMLLNSKFMLPGSGENCMQPGDTVALLTSAAPGGSGVRKPFLIFSFQVCSSPSVQPFLDKERP